MTSRISLPLPLLGGAIGAHAADQIALAALPLTATIALEAGAATVGWLVAAHAAAWLVLSLPAGMLLDRYPGRTLPLLAQLSAMVAFAAAALFA